MKKKNSVPCVSGCPVQKAAQLLEGKWTLLIIRDLLGGPRRYAELKESVGAITPRMLALRLQALAAAGLVKRTVLPSVPPGTRYALTPLGQEMRPLIGALAAFGQRLR